MKSDDNHPPHEEVPTGVHPEYPEHRYSVRLSIWWVGGWISPALTILFTILWCLWIYHAIGNRPVNWQYGTMPYVPGQSAFSTRPSPAGAVTNQVELVSNIEMHDR